MAKFCGKCGSELDETTGLCLKGKSIFDDTVIAGSDALYIARQNGDKYEVYRFAAEK